MGYELKRKIDLFLYSWKKNPQRNSFNSERCKTDWENFFNSKFCTKLQFMLNNALMFDANILTAIANRMMPKNFFKM